MTITRNDLANVMKKYNANVNSKFDSKVDKISGKTLSTNDYTTNEKNKLAGIATGSTKTINSSTNGNINVNGSEQVVYTHPTTHSASMITGLSTVATSGSYNDLSGKPSTFPPSSHTHDDRYYTETEINTKLSGKANDVDVVKKVISKASGTHVNTCYETGIYKSTGWTGYPNGLPDGQGTLIVMNYGGDCATGWVEHEFITPHGNGRYIGAYSGGVWSGWERVTTDKTLNDRGYLDTVWKENVNWNTITENGLYRFNSWDSSTNVPDKNIYGSIAGTCEVCLGNDVITQTINGNSNLMGGIKLFRVGTKSNGVWGPWQQIASSPKYGPTRLSNPSSPTPLWKIIQDNRVEQGYFVFDSYQPNITEIPYTAPWTVSVSGGAAYTGSYTYYATLIATQIDYPEYIYVGNIFGGSFTGWKQISTTAKTPFNLTPQTGYSIVENASYKMNNIAYIKATIQKNSGNFTDSTIFATSPYYNGLTALSCFGASSSTGVKGVGVQSYISKDGQIRCLTDTANFNLIYLTGEVVL